MIIEVLHPSVAAQIAAGEVVERPASVVKELVNAIDAGATYVQVSIEEGGTRSVHVVDNGAGIPEEQLMLAFSRHATSKLRTADDLNAISTLGFRGEALPSIAAVSLLTCTSRTQTAEAGTRVTLHYGDPQNNPQPGSSSPGTSIRVENLFSNQPARLKFLKTKPTEAAQVQRVIARYATAYPQIRSSTSTTAASTSSRTAPAPTGNHPPDLGLRCRQQDAAREDSPILGTQPEYRQDERT